jgi:hypothetical protein
MIRTLQMKAWIGTASYDEANAAGLTGSSMLINESGVR